MRRAGWAAAAAVLGWYLVALAVLYPLADAPVVDSWMYGSAVRRFLHTGELRFAGYSLAMPYAQVIYGAAWARAFGANSVSLEISVVVLAIACGVMFHALAIRCGAERWQAMAATGLLVLNPCFTFLSFSFMTEVPFLVTIVAAHLAFAKAGAARREPLWLWLAAAIAVVAFAIRPFGAMVILGCAGAILLYRAAPPGSPPSPRIRLAATLAPFGAALALCAIFWIWLTIVSPRSWALRLEQAHFRYLFLVPLSEYLRSGVLGPLLYLGIVLSPLALLQVATPKARRVAAGAVAIFLTSLVLIRIDNRLPVTPECSCFGGWRNVLILRGASNRFSWDGNWQYAFLALGSFGAAGLIAAFAQILRLLSRAAAAILIAAAIYWAALIPLWFYNDRYYLVIVPAGAIVLALAPLPKRRAVKAAAFAMTLAMGLVSLGGTYAYQRGLEVILRARNLLEREGVPRSSIDAGYSLNGEDLYRYPRHGIETMELEAGIPMVTSEKVTEYAIAIEPIPGAQILRRLKWPGPLGLGHRHFYLIKQPPAAPRTSITPPEPPPRADGHSEAPPPAPWMRARVAAAGIHDEIASVVTILPERPGTSIGRAGSRRGRD